jgi:hypothetical protein
MMSLLDPKISRAVVRYITTRVHRTTREERVGDKTEATAVTHALTSYGLGASMRHDSLHIVVQGCFALDVTS